MFPRIMLFEFHDDTKQQPPVARLELLDAWPNHFPEGKLRLENGRRQGYDVPGFIGDPLTDNSMKEDGYRFHDALHIGIMAGLGWSPVMRGLLGLKRRSNPEVDVIDDGGRAIILEESLFDFMGMSKVEFGDSIEEDIDLIFATQAIKYAIDERGTGTDRFSRQEFEHALLTGAQLFQEVKRNRGGYALANLDNRQALYIPKNTNSYISPLQARLTARETLQQKSS